MSLIVSIVSNALCTKQLVTTTSFIQEFGAPARRIPISLGMLVNMFEISMATCITSFPSNMEDELRQSIFLKKWGVSIILYSRLAFLSSKAVRADRFSIYAPQPVVIILPGYKGALWALGFRYMLPGWLRSTHGITQFFICHKILI